MDRSDARELPIEPDGTQEEGARDLIVADVVKLESACVLVAQQHVAFIARAEITEAHHLPIQSDGAQQRGAGDLIVVDVVDFQFARAGIAQDQVAFGAVIGTGRLRVSASRRMTAESS